MSILDETRRIVEDSPLPVFFPFFHPVVSRVSSFSVTPCTSLRKTALRPRARKQVGDFAKAEIEKRRLYQRWHIVLTSRFAFYITFILLHFSRDKCLRGFASRLGKCFHNVLLCRSLLILPVLPRLASPRAFSFFLRPCTRNRGIK